MFKKIITIVTNEGKSGLSLRFRILARKIKLSLDRFLQRRVVRSAYGVDFVANYNDATFKFYVTGVYGDYYSSYLATVQPNFIFLDIGANQGLYSIIAARNQACNAVYAFEPTTKTEQLLVQNLSLNAVVGKVKVINSAISDYCGSAFINLEENHSGAASLVVGASRGTSDESVSVIDYTQLDLILSSEVVEEVEELHVKIDVEGHEKVVLEQLFKTRYASKIKHVFYECDEGMVSYESLSAILQSHGFELKKVGYGRHYDVSASRVSD